MLFTSYEFLAFLAATIIAYYLMPRKYRWILLLFASFTFYAFSGWNNFIYIAVTTISTFALAGIIGRLGKQQKEYLKIHKGEMSVEERKAYKAVIKKKQTAFLVTAIVINFGLLAVLKVLSTKGFLLPLGISFYTFTAMGYLIDVYRGKYEQETNIGKFALYVSFFPQLIQGPINRFDDMKETLFGTPDETIGVEDAQELALIKQARKEKVYRDLTFGLERIIWGYFKKLVIADRVLPAVKVLIADPNEYTGVYVFIAMVLYALQLYADFTGGIDITIGIAEMLGISMKENFIRPFFSKNLAEYWKRWHISLGTWFTEYIFYPVSVSTPMLKLGSWGRKHINDYIGKRLPVYVSSLIVWFVTGIWHGVGANFIVWGLLNGIILIISQELEPLYAKFHARVQTGRAWDGFMAIRTVFITSTLRMLDLYRDVPLTFKMLWDMIAHPQFADLTANKLATLGLALSDVIVVVIATLTLFTVSMIQRSGSVRVKISNKGFGFAFSIFAILLLIVIVFGAYGIGYDASQFIYNQF